MAIEVPSTTYRLRPRRDDDKGVMFGSREGSDVADARRVAFVAPAYVRDRQHGCPTTGRRLPSIYRGVRMRPDATLAGALGDYCTIPTGSATSACMPNALTR